MEYCTEQFIPRGGFCKQIMYLFCQNFYSFTNILFTFLPFLQNSTLVVTLVCLHFQQSTFLLLNHQILLICGHYIHSSFKTFPELAGMVYRNFGLPGRFQL